MSKLPYLQADGEFYHKQRMRAFVRDNFTCQFEQLGLDEIEGHCTCARPQTTLKYLQCHHIQFRIHGGTHDLDNLLIVCKSHHAMIHPHMRFELDLDMPSLEVGYVKEFEMKDKEL